MKRTFVHKGMLLLVLPLVFAGSLKAQIFVNPIPIPYLMNGNNFSLDVTAGSHNFDPNGFLTDINLNVSLPTYCYNATGNSGMSYLGPTMVFEKDDSMYFNITNLLPGGIETTVHWHGLNIPAGMDGGPHQVIANGALTPWTPKFKVIDPVQTVWYHTHLMDQTTDQVIRGLAGMIIVKDNLDPLESQLPHSYGENDFPIVIQEKGFDTTTVAPITATGVVAGEKPGNGKYTLVNGVVGGYLHVAPEMTRLRILNGSPRKMFNIGLSTELNNPTSFAPMHMVATGGGYLDVPHTMTSTLMAVGDRREFVVDFSLYANGDTVYMSNLPIASNEDYYYGATNGKALMAFIVEDALFPTDPIISVPATLAPYSLAPGVVSKDRTKRLMIGTPPPGNGQGGPWTIDGDTMNMMVINDTVLVNTKERWTIINETTKAHPFHIHKVQFQVVEYTGKLGTNNTVATYTYPNLPDELIGYKDVQLIREGATLVFEARFDEYPSSLDPTNGYMYHCHILTHEDASMMHQFVVVDSIDFFTGISSIPGTESLVVYPNPAENTLSFKGSENESGILRLYDLRGTLIEEIDIQSLGATTLDVVDLPRGILILEFTSGEKRFVQKVTLQ